MPMLTIIVTDAKSAIVNSRQSEKEKLKNLLYREYLRRIFLIKTKILCLVVLLNLMTLPVEAKFCDHHPKICAKIHAIQDRAKTAYGKAKVFCQNNLPVAQFAAAALTVLFLL